MAVHGWVFMVYVVVAFLLVPPGALEPGFTILTLVAGLIPLLIFWVEHRVNRPGPRRAPGARW